MRGKSCFDSRHEYWIVCLVSRYSAAFRGHRVFPIDINPVETICLQDRQCILDESIGCGETSNKITENMLRRLSSLLENSNN